RRLMFQRRDVRQTQSHQVWDFQRARFRNMPKCVAARVAIVRRGRKFPDSHAIQHDPENSFEFFHRRVPRTLFSETLPHTLPQQLYAAIPIPCGGQALAWLFVALASSRLSQFFPVPALLYSVANRSLNYFPSARVVQGSGGLPCPRTVVPEEFPSSSPLSSLRSGFFFSCTTGVQLSIPGRFWGPTGPSSSSSSESARFGIARIEAAIPTRLRESLWAPLSARL